MKARTLNRHLDAGRKRAVSKREAPLASSLESVFTKAGDDAARRFRASADHLTAAAPAPTGTMVAVYPDPDEAVKLALPDGEPAGILHVTLAYLGETEPDQAEAAVAVVQQVASENGRLEGIVGGIAAFAASEGSDGLSPSILLPDVPGLAELRMAVCDALEAAGIEWATSHGWTPHLTLAYTEAPAPPPEYLLGLPLTFDRLTLARGDVPRDFVLGESELGIGVDEDGNPIHPVTAAGPPPDWTAPHPDEVVDVEALVEQLRTKSDPVRRAAIAAAATPALKAAGLDFDVTNPLVGAVLAHSGQHVTQIADSTRLNVMRTIREAYEQGLSIDDTAAAIRAGMAAAGPARARLIARTELVGVVNGGAVAAAVIVGQAAGVTYWKRWLVAEGADFPRHEEYDGLDGQTVGLDEMFDVGGAQLEYPGDPGGPPEEICNCRCDVVMVESPDAEVESSGGGAFAALTSIEDPSLGGHVKRSTVRTRTRRAAHAASSHEANGAAAREEIAQLADRATGAPNVFARRRAAREALTAAGVAEPVLVTNYEMTQGSLAERWFIQAALEAGFTELTSDQWPTESTRLVDDKRIVFRDGDYAAVYRLKDGTVALVAVMYGRCRVSTAGPTAEMGRTACAAFRSVYPASYLMIEDDPRVPITFWTDGPYGAISRLRKIEAATWPDVEGNYPSAIRDSLASMMAWENGPETDGQLMLLQGPPGTGKTWVLRALAAEWAKWAEFHYITDPDAFFVDKARYMVEVLLSDSYDVIDESLGKEVSETDPEGKWRVLILEDTGELLAANAKEAYGQGLSRLLNVVDGMIGQGLKVLAIVTTNDELGDLHPAVKRDGRCAVSLEFGAFSPEEASEWLGEMVEEGGTLAELYARKNGTVEPRELAEGEVLEEGTLAASATVQLGERIPFADGLPAEAEPRDERPERNETPAPVVVEPSTNAGQVRWEGTLLMEGKMTDDGRYIEPGATAWRELPLTLMAMLETSEGGHVGAQVAGRIDEIWRGEANPDGSVPVFGRGVFDDSEFGHEVARMVDDRVLRGNSVDLAIRGFELAYRHEFDENGHRIPEEEEEAAGEEVDPIDVLFGEDLVFVFTDCVIGASTVCPFPAFADAQISLAASGGFVWVATRPNNMVLTAPGAVAVPSTVGHMDGEPGEGTQLSVPEVIRASAAELEAIKVIPAGEAVTASAAGLVPLFPPAEWFADPEFEELTALTVDEEGRVFGHLAEWDTCHIGIPGVCTTAPRSLTNYAYFHLGEVETDTGDRVACGKVTLDTNHAAKHLGRQAATDHYDHTGATVADVVAGEDEFGPWVAGALRPDVSAERVRAFMGAQLSGDWRNVNGNLELVAILAVNVPGFPVPRTRAAIVASGDGLQVMALTAAGVHDGTPTVEKLSAGDRARLTALAARADGGLAGLAELAAGAAA